MNNGAKINQKSIKDGPTINQNSPKNRVPHRFLATKTGVPDRPFFLLVFSGVLGGSWGALGGVLEASWTGLGSLLASLGSALKASWAVLERRRGILEASWSVLRTSWAVFGAILFAQNVFFEPCYLGCNFSTDFGRGVFGVIDYCKS